MSAIEEVAKRLHTYVNANGGRYPKKFIIPRSLAAQLTVEMLEHPWVLEHGMRADEDGDMLFRGVGIVGEQDG